MDEVKETITAYEAIEAAKIIQGYCITRSSCKRCIFRVTCDDCALYYEPNYWEIPENNKKTMCKEWG